MRGKKLCGLLMVFVSLTMVCGCSSGETSSKTANTSASDTGGIESTADSTEQADDVKTPEMDSDKQEDGETDIVAPDNEGIYAPVLEENITAIREGNYRERLEQSSYLLDSMTFEISVLEPEDILQKYGYIIMDINEDGVPELLIGKDNYVIGAYTFQDDTIVRFLDYAGVMDDNACFFGTDGCFYRTIMSEAGPGVIIETLPKNATEMTCVEYYFMKYEPQRGDYVFYHNTSGEYDSQVSEELDQDTYFSILNDVKTRYLTLEFQSLAGFAGLSESGGAQIDHTTGLTKDELYALYEATKKKDAEIQARLDEAWDMRTMNEAADERYEVWDTMMNAVLDYFETTLSEQEMVAVMEEQEKWFEEKKAIAEAEAAEYEGGTAYPLTLTMTHARETQARVEVLMQKIYK